MANITWKQSPPDNSYDDPNDWSTGTVPAAGDTAIFGKTSKPSLISSKNDTVDAWIFEKGASHYTITNTGDFFDFVGAGIVVQGGSVRISGSLRFDNQSSAGSATITENTGDELFFQGSAKAGSAVINSAGEFDLSGESSADHAKITNKFHLDFGENSTAGNAVITTTATGTTTFAFQADGGSAQFITQQGGKVDFSQTTGAGNPALPLADVVNVGSIAGAGDYYLGGDTLFITSNRSTVVSGLVSGGGPLAPESEGELVKGGTGTLTLSHRDKPFLTAGIFAGTLDVAAQGAAGAEVVFFDNQSGTLKIDKAALDASHQFDTPIFDFAINDVIDLAGLKFVAGAKATLNSGELTVKSGNVTDVLQLAWPDTPDPFSGFKAVSDGHDGTKIIGTFPTWKANPVSSDYNNQANWSTGTVPSSDTLLAQPFPVAVFGKTSKPHIVVSTDTEAQFVGEWIFQKGASHYTFTDNQNVFNFEGAGIVVQGGSVQLSGTIHFVQGSSAGTAKLISQDASHNLVFTNTATAAHAVIDWAGTISFSDSGTADHANITNHRFLLFGSSSNAGYAVITTTGTGKLTFSGNSDGGSAQFVTQAHGVVDFSQTAGTDDAALPDRDGIVHVGSIAGAGDYDIGRNVLFIIGNESTTVSGVVSGPGELAKGGTGTLTLSNGDNTIGLTLIMAGTLNVTGQGAGGSIIEFDDSHMETLKIGNAALDADHQFGTELGYTAIDDFDRAQNTDVIDLTGLKFVKGAHATYNAGTELLSVTSGKVTDTVFLENPGVTSFKALSDGHGGTKIVGVATGEKPLNEAHAEHATALDPLHLGFLGSMD